MQHSLGSATQEHRSGNEMGKRNRVCRVSRGRKGGPAGVAERPLWVPLAQRSHPRARLVDRTWGGRYGRWSSTFNTHRKRKSGTSVHLWRKPGSHLNKNVEPAQKAPLEVSDLGGHRRMSVRWDEIGLQRSQGLQGRWKHSPHLPVLRGAPTRSPLALLLAPGPAVPS